MKKYLIFFFAILMAASSLVLTSCSSDDESGDETNYSKMIVGSWTISYSLGNDHYSTYVHFYANGTYKAVDIDVIDGTTEKDFTTGTWSISGNNITMPVEGLAGIESVTCPITKMTATEMIITVLGFDTKYTKIADSVFEQYYNQK